VTWDFLGPLIYMLAVLNSLALSIWTFLRFRRQTGRSKDLAGAVLLLVCSLWLLTHIMERIFPSIQAKTIWDQIEYLFMLAVAVSWFVYATCYTGLEKQLRSRYWIVFGALLAVTMVLIFTNSLHHFFWTAEALTDPRNELPKTYGLGFHFVLGAILLLVVGGVVRVIRHFRYSYRMYPQQTKILPAAVLLATAVAIAEGVFDLSPLAPYQLTPLAYTLVVWAIVWAIKRARRADIVSVSRTAVLENMDDIVIVIDDQNQIIDLNKAGQRALNSTKKEAIGQPLSATVPQLHSHIDGVYGVDFDIALDSDEGFRTYSVLISPLKDWPRKLLSQVIVLRDVTDRNRLEKALRQSEREYRGLVENAHDAIIIFSPPDFQILAVNSRACEVYGYGREEFLDESLQTISRDPRQEEEFFQSLIQEGGFRTYEIAHGRKDNTEISLEVNCSSVVYSNRYSVLSINRDITARKRTEEELKRYADQLRSSNDELQQFAYVASHDLQEPLRMVTNYMDLLKKRYSELLNEDANEFMDFAVDGARRMQGLLNDLLNYSRVGTQRKPFEAVECETVLIEVLKNLRVAIEESGALVTHDPLPVVIGDPSQLLQVFQNLLSNALKFHTERRPEVHVGAVMSDGMWLLSVRDNGIGIDMQYGERIFQIFQRLHTREEYGGSGVGLAVCKRIVERHQGRIWLESKPGEGATFFFTLPRGNVQAVVEK
jgi:PAS domain S-box-containing protein